MSVNILNLTDVHQLSLKIKLRARALGFELVGITDARPSSYEDYLQTWLADGQAGTMHYLTRRFDERSDPSVYLSGAKSVICVAMNYHVELDPIPSSDDAVHGKIARYALGDDYHEVMKPRLHQLADWLREVAPEAQTKVCVDTAPVMEKELAARAGIGWQGKNTCVISPRIGSWILLGEILTTLELESDDPATDRCGTCTRCIDACPTNAITAPYQLDARKCISYLTIEHRGDIEDYLKSQMSDWMYGCDICQDVCPFNHEPPIAFDQSLQPRFSTGTLDARSVQNWDASEYQTKLRHSAMKRVKLPVLQRNARIVVDNAGRGTTP